MRVLLELTTTNYKVWHSLAKRLKELYPDCVFACLLGVAHNAKNAPLRFLKEQDDVAYEFIQPIHEILGRAVKADIDREALARLELGLPHKSLWRMIAADRALGHQFLHGNLSNRNFLNEVGNDRDGILRFVSGLVKSYEEIFDRFKPDLFLPAMCMNSVSALILEQLCYRYGLPYIVPSNVRVKNYFAFSADTQLRYPQIDRTYHDFYSGKLEPMPDAQKLYQLLMDEIENPVYFDRLNADDYVIRTGGIKGKLRLLIILLKIIVKTSLNWFGSSKMRRSDDIRRQPNRLSVLMSNFYDKIRFILQKVEWADNSFADKIDLKEKYLYYPLHINPEYSTQIQGTMWLDQLHLIELLAKSVPFDWKIYVKEHPGTLIDRVRPKGFYKRIKALPNVFLLPIDADMHSLISNAQLVAVITGTSGWEAILRGKPVIGFADNMWDVLGLSRKCSDIDKISLNIREELEKSKQISREERKKRIISFLSAMLIHSFEVSYPRQFSYRKHGTDQEYEIVGRETADALIKHLKLLKLEDNNVVV
jgi:Capsule polysaccharide biosynthesis protein